MQNQGNEIDFEAGWRAALVDNEWITVTYAVVGLTNFGEKPVPSARLAEVLARPVGEVEALARRWGWPGTRVDEGIITVDPERAPSAPRRRVQVGDRQFGVSGCGGDIFLYAPLVRPSLHLEERCPTTGTPIRIVFTPSRVESVDPDGAVLPMPPAGDLDQTRGMHIEEIDANLCVQAPLYSSAEAAGSWLANLPGGRVMPIREAWDTSFFRGWRERMSALLFPGGASAADGRYR